METVTGEQRPVARWAVAGAGMGQPGEPGTGQSCRHRGDTEASRSSVPPRERAGPAGPRAGGVWPRAESRLSWGEEGAPARPGDRRSPEGRRNSEREASQERVHWSRKCTSLRAVGAGPGMRWGGKLSRQTAWRTFRPA